ncbi:feruloyl esterase B precursor [Pyrenochaeta sp. MPI-SDFR-AT-0127]|nr:feruloyl esterase B precursor [Pyrenochaeta sp. MPI-SDFR-AT-0127]
MLLNHTLLRLLPFLAFAAASTSTVPDCNPDALPTPEVFGASILEVDAVQVVDSTLSTSPISFCNVSITYTHPGQNDIINIWLWLPSTWNGRFQGVGGGGWITGLEPPNMIDAVSKGYAAVSTDGGHYITSSVPSWGLASPGNVNLYNLQNFASVALNDMTVLGKQLTEAYYGKNITKSYWNGCSTGGRQGLMMAQRYPDAYDGILSVAPAINWAEFIPTMLWPQWLMRKTDYVPTQCELGAITAAAISACDELDGLKDGVVAMPWLCDFKAASVVGQPYSCGDTEGKISEQAAFIAQSTWTGARNSDGAFQWFGVIYGTPFSGLANTTCAANGTCTGEPFYVTTDWHQVFLRGDPNFDVYSLSHEEWDAAFLDSKQRYQSIIGTSDPNLSRFKKAGGKMITWHGLTDELIAFNGTVDYYDRVSALDANVTDFYRFYMAPGVEHCYGGSGAVPTDPLAALVRWVEEGDVPETLAANRTVNGTHWKQDLCLYPLSSVYQGGDPAEASSFRCQ